MRRYLVAFDSETDLIGPARLAPRMACLTFRLPNEEPGIFLQGEPNLRRVFEEWLDSALLVGHNVAYDMGVCGAQWPELLSKIFRAYEEDRVTDTMLRQKLIDIATGCYRGYMSDSGEFIKYEYSLQALTKRLTGRWLDKDEWRLRYGELIDKPLEEWPAGALSYPKEDARATLDCYLAQEKNEHLCPSQFHEARAAFALHLTAAWGLRTDGAKVARLRRETEDELDELRAGLVSAGLVRADNSRNTKATKELMEQACAQAGKPVRRTKAGQVSLDADACEYADNDLLSDYARVTTLGKVLSADVPMLEKGTKMPIHTRFDLAGSGRSTSSSPNVQNIRRMARHV